MVGLSPRCASPCRLAGLALCLWLPACEDGDGACVKLDEDGLLVTAYIDHDGKQARTEIEVRRVDDDAGLSLGLCKRHAIYVDGVGATRVRRPSGSYVYKVDAKDKATGDAMITHQVRLRSDGDDVTYAVAVETPAFQITAPASGSSQPRATAWDIAWEPGRPGSTIVARIDDAIDGESCLAEPLLLELPDEGATQISPGQLKAALKSSERCEATIRLSRVASVALAPAGGGASTLHADSRAVVAIWREREFFSVQ